ncbi:MAG TPA: ABC-2 family transporter protein [Mycobacteriales bacterium]|nr:ABC-2 family transporter protein [Mycobacteriales bacterium]
MIGRQIRVLRRMTVSHLSMTMAYRGDMAFIMIGTVAVPLVSLLVWRAALASGASLPVDREYLTTYFVVLSFVRMATSSWLARFLAEDIRLGRLSSWLVRPISPVFEHLANNLSEKTLKGLILLPMIGVLALIFADSMRLPADPVTWLLFLVSTLLGAVLVFMLDYLVGCLAFWIDDIAALDRGRTLLANVLSGAVVPLALAPAWARGFVDLQPFRFTVSFPVEILLGRVSAGELVLGLVVQAGYAGAALLSAVFVWRRGIRAYSAVGV